MDKHVNDYLEFLLNNCLVLFFKSFGFEYVNCSHFIDENVLDNFLGQSTEKEFYLATTKTKQKWYFLRPEMTYVSILEQNNLQNTMFCYSGFCFRHERKQFCRFREFLQFGVEAIYSNVNKVRYVSYYLIFLTFCYLKHFVNNVFLKQNVVLDVFYNSEEQRVELENIFNTFKDFFSLLSVNVCHITRQGNGITPYNGITFEYHVMSDANGIHKQKNKYEFLGGGEYCYKNNNGKYFGTGFGSGTKRLCLCFFDYEKVKSFISNNVCKQTDLTVIVNMNNSNVNVFVQNIVNLLKKINFNKPHSIDLQFSKKYNYNWVFKNNTTILV